MHRMCEKTLWAWASGALHGRRGRRVEAHLKQCLRCADIVAAYQKTLEIAKSQRPILPDAAEVLSQRNRLMARIRPQSDQRPAWRTPLIPRWAFVSGVFLLGLSSGLALNRYARFLNGGSTHDLNHEWAGFGRLTSLEVTAAEGRPGQVELRFDAQESKRITGRLDAQAVQCALASSLLSEPRASVRLRHIDLVRLTDDSGPVAGRPHHPGPTG